MTDEEDVLDVALSMIDTRRWGLRSQLVTLVRLEARRHPSGWAWLSRRRAERLLACAPRYGYRLLDELVEERVLELGMRGSGTRPSAYRVTPDPDRWQVPWRELDREFRRARLELARAPRRATNGASVARSHIAPLDALAARSHGAPLDGLVARSMSAPLTDRQWRDIDRATSPPPSSLGEQSTNGDPDQVSLERARAITDAVETKTGRPVYGSLAARVRSLAGRADVDAMLEAVATAPVEFQPPLLVDHLERVAHGQAVDTVRRPGPAPRAVQLIREVDRLETLIHVEEQSVERMRADGYPEEVLGDELERLRGELAECQNELQREGAKA